MSSKILSQSQLTTSHQTDSAITAQANAELTPNPPEQRAVLSKNELAPNSPELKATPSQTELNQNIPVVIDSKLESTNIKTELTNAQTELNHTDIEETAGAGALGTNSVGKMAANIGEAGVGMGTLVTGPVNSDGNQATSLDSALVNSTFKAEHAAGANQGSEVNLVTDTNSKHDKAINSDKAPNSEASKIESSKSEVNKTDSAIETLDSTREPFEPKAFLKTVPNLPGSYRMYDVNDTVIYVGKAKDLKKRLSSYFLKHGQSTKTQALVSNIARIEFTVTFTESEALILENELIKKYQPRYNILLRDDKSYPYLLLTSKHEHPGIYFHRGAKRKLGEYFGPFPDSNAVKESLRLLQRLFPVRQCEDSVYAHRSRPCLMAQMGRCLAPCVPMSPEKAQHYQEQVSLLRLFLKGQNQLLLQTMAQKMEEHAEKLEFEEAALLRDQITALRRVQESNSIISDVDYPLDVIGHAMEDGLCCIHVLYIRQGRLLGSRSFFPKLSGNRDIAHIIYSFLTQFYLNETHSEMLPDEILLDCNLQSMVANLAISQVQVQAQEQGQSQNQKQPNVSNQIPNQSRSQVQLDAQEQGPTMNPSLAQDNAQVKAQAQDNIQAQAQDNIQAQAQDNIQAQAQEQNQVSDQFQEQGVTLSVDIPAKIPFTDALSTAPDKSLAQADHMVANSLANSVVNNAQFVQVAQDGLLAQTTQSAQDNQGAKKSAGAETLKSGVTNTLSQGKIDNRYETQPANADSAVAQSVNTDKTLVESSYKTTGDSNQDRLEQSDQLNQGTHDVQESQNAKNQNNQNAQDGAGADTEISEVANELNESESVDLAILADALRQKFGKKIRFSWIARGAKSRYVKLATANASVAIQSRLSSLTTAHQRIEELEKLLGLSDVERMECYDISHTMGENTVASCVVFNREGPDPTRYRRYTIHDVTPGDDFAAMHQVLTRRFKDPDNSELPELIFIDGGMGQLAQAEEVLTQAFAQAKHPMPMMVAVAKGEGRKEGLETLITGFTHEKIHLPLTSAALQLVLHIRDESHRFAITGHRAKRAKARTTSKLESIPGIGPKRRQALLQHLGGIQEVLRASVEELQKVPGISLELANKIYDELHSL